MNPREAAEKISFDPERYHRGEKASERMVERSAAIIARAIDEATAPLEAELDKKTGIMLQAVDAINAAEAKIGTLKAEVERLTAELAHNEAGDSELFEAVRNLEAEVKRLTRERDEAIRVRDNAHAYSAETCARIQESEQSRAALAARVEAIRKEASGLRDAARAAIARLDNPLLDTSLFKDVRDGLESALRNRDRRFELGQPTLESDP